MGLLTKTIIVMLCINIALTIGGISLGGDDIISRLVNINPIDNKVTLTDNLNETLPDSMEPGSVTTGTSILGFIDGLKMVGGVILLILSVAVAPFYWPFVLGFPIWLTLLFVPFGMTFILGVIYVIRGSSG